MGFATVRIEPHDFTHKLLPVAGRIPLKVILIFVGMMPLIETVGVAALGQVFQLAEQAWVKRASGHRIINGFAINLRGTCHIVEGFGATLDLEAVNTDRHELLHVFHSTEVLGVHDVGPMFILHDRHQFARAIFLLEKVDLIGQRMSDLIAHGGVSAVQIPQGEGELAGYIISLRVFDRRLDIVFPAAGVGAGALIGIPMVEIPGQKAAAGVSNAERAMDEDLKFHLRARIPNFCNLLERKFTREDDATNPDVLPETHGRMVDGIGLHREVNGKVWPGVSGHHDQPRISHDQRIRPHFHDGGEITDESIDLAIMWKHIGREEKRLAHGVGLGNPNTQIFFQEVIISDSQAIARQSGIDGICAIGEGISHVLQGACWRQEFRGFHGVWREVIQSANSNLLLTVFLRIFPPMAISGCFKTLRDCVGNTPLVRLQRLPGETSNVILAKLEGNNPAGSVKDRPALSMIRHAEARGEIRPGDRLIEATSGNTGIALAMAAAMMGYRMTLIMPENMSAERRASMRAFGAEIILTPAEGSMEAAIDHARLMQSRGEGRILDQFSNPDNPRAHFEGTGPEIWRDTEGTVTHFISAMGTTGTIMGTSAFLKSKNPGIEIIGVQPEGASKIPGIRRWPKEYLPKICDFSRIDRILDVEQSEAESMTRALAVQEGIFAGVSSGGAVAAALRVSKTVSNAVITVIICDRGDRYLSTGVFPDR